MLFHYCCLCGLFTFILVVFVVVFLFTCFFFAFYTGVCCCIQPAIILFKCIASLHKAAKTFTKSLPALPCLLYGKFIQIFDFAINVNFVTSLLLFVWSVHIHSCGVCCCIFVYLFFFLPFILGFVVIFLFACLSF